MTTPFTLERTFHVSAHAKGRKVFSAVQERQKKDKTLRITRLMALAIHFDRLLRDSTVANYAEVARLGHVSPARISQIMNLLLLAADIQEQILFLPCEKQGRDPIHLRQLQPIALQPDWSQQRRMWRELLADRLPDSKTEKVEQNCVDVPGGAR